MIDQKDRMIHALFRQEGTEIVVVFARFMALEVQQIHRSETTRMAMYMIENKNNQTKLKLSYKYQSLSYCLLSRSILGCFAISRL